MLMSEPPAHLVRVDPAGPGLSRRRRGPDWSYYNEAGEPIVVSGGGARTRTGRLWVRRDYVRRD